MKLPISQTLQAQRVYVPALTNHASILNRYLEGILEERGVKVDSVTLNRWIVCYSSSLALEDQSRKRAVTTSWRMNETCIKVKCEWVYLYGAR